ncbi:MAG: RiPP maturation radical SAM C-methyltransferase [Candidatus Aminicenantes bacterium]|nr:RiPP maturation radical SAM C-methyltransferase [Candidatus Aminicenantes bacterium]
MKKAQVKPGMNVLASHLPVTDVLLIVPPGAPTETPSLAPHLLQASCQSIGISVGVFYANLHFAGLIGVDLYNTIIALEQMTSIGERLFCASAFDLPPMGRNIHRLINPNWLPDHIWQKRGEIAFKKMSENFTPIRKWVLSVDWQQVEGKASQWIKSVTEQISGMDYRVVGCSNTNGRLAPSIALLKHVKQANPDIITVLGGALCEGEMAEGILSLETNIDYIFSGESDITFPAFCKDVLTGKRPKEKIIYCQEVKNLDEIPVPDYREYFRQLKLFSINLPKDSTIAIPYETSRGCRWKKCKFCGLNGEAKSYRAKSGDKVLRDFEYINNLHPGIPVHMVDNMMPLQYFNSLFPRLPEALPSLRFQFELSANLELDQVIALKKAGAYRIQPGIETLSSSLLKRMAKGTTIRHIIATLRYARSLEIDVWWNILYGFPGDQVHEYEEMMELMRLIHHLPPPGEVLSMRIPRFCLYQTAPAEYTIPNPRPAAFYNDVLPLHAQKEKLANFFAGNFKAQSYEHPEIISNLQEEFNFWSRAWGRDKAITKNSQPPTLFMERNSKSSGDFVLYDTRGLPGLPEKLVVDRKKAGILLTATPWDESSVLRWAVDAKLGVVSESWFIPLVTTEIDILQEFERRQGER